MVESNTNGGDFDDGGDGSWSGSGSGSGSDSDQGSYSSSASASASESFSGDEEMVDEDIMEEDEMIDEDVMEDLPQEESEFIVEDEDEEYFEDYNDKEEYGQQRDLVQDTPLSPPPPPDEPPPDDEDDTSMPQGDDVEEFTEFDEDNFDRVEQFEDQMKGAFPPLASGDDADFPEEEFTEFDDNNFDADGIVGGDSFDQDPPADDFPSSPQHQQTKDDGFGGSNAFGDSDFGDNNDAFFPSQSSQQQQQDPFFVDDDAIDGGDGSGFPTSTTADAFGMNDQDGFFSSPTQQDKSQLPGTHDENSNENVFPKQSSDSFFSPSSDDDDGVFEDAASGDSYGFDDNFASAAAPTNTTSGGFFNDNDGGENDDGGFFPSSSEFGTQSDKPTTDSAQLSKGESHGSDTNGEVVVEQWVERNHNEPDDQDLDAACRKIYLALYHQELKEREQSAETGDEYDEYDDLPDIDTMIRRTPKLRELYRSLKQQYWFKVHNGEIESFDESIVMTKKKAPTNATTSSSATSSSATAVVTPPHLPVEATVSNDLHVPAQSQSEPIEAESHAHGQSHLEEDGLAHTSSSSNSRSSSHSSSSSTSSHSSASSKSGSNGGDDASRKSDGSSRSSKSSSSHNLGENVNGVTMEASSSMDDNGVAIDALPEMNTEPKNDASTTEVNDGDDSSNILDTGIVVPIKPLPPEPKLTASQKYEELLEKKRKYEYEIDEDELEYWELAARQERGDQLSESELFDMEDLRNDLGIEVDAIAEKVDRAENDDELQQRPQQDSVDTDESAFDGKSEDNEDTPTPPKDEKEVGLSSELEREEKPRVTSANSKFESLLSLRKVGGEVDEDELEYWELAARIEKGEELTDSELGDMEELRLDLGIESPSQYYRPSKAWVDDNDGDNHGAHDEEIQDNVDSASFFGDAFDQEVNKPMQLPESQAAMAVNEDGDPSIPSQITAQEKYEELLSKQKRGLEDVDDDLLYYWEMAARQEAGEELTESEHDEMEELRLELGIDDPMDTKKAAQTTIATDDNDATKTTSSDAAAEAVGNTSTPSTEFPGMSASAKYQELLGLQKAGKAVDEDLLEYCFLASRQERGEELTESEIDDMEELRMDLGLEKAASGNVGMTFQPNSVQQEVESSKNDDGLGDAAIIAKEQALPTTVNTVIEMSVDKQDSSMKFEASPPDAAKSTRTASSKHQELLQKLKNGEDIDEDLIEFWELAARQEKGEELSESDIEDMEELGRDLGIDPKKVLSAPEPMDSGQRQMTSQANSSKDDVKASAGEVQKGPLLDEDMQAREQSETSNNQESSLIASQDETEEAAGTLPLTPKESPTRVVNTMDLASKKYQELLDIQATRGGVNEDLLDYWCLASKDEDGEILSKVESDRMNRLRLELGIEIDVKKPSTDTTGHLQNAKSNQSQFASNKYQELLNMQATRGGVNEDLLDFWDLASRDESGEVLTRAELSKMNRLGSELGIEINAEKASSDVTGPRQPIKSKHLQFASNKYQELLNMQATRGGVNEDLLDYWDLASREECGEELTRSELNRMSRLKLELGIEDYMEEQSNDVTSPTQISTMYEPKEIMEEDFPSSDFVDVPADVVPDDSISESRDQADVQQSILNVPMAMDVSIDEASKSSERRAPHSTSLEPTDSASTTYLNLKAMLKNGEDIDDDILEYWELAARHERGEELTESEIDDMEELRVDLGINKVEPAPLDMPDTAHPNETHEEYHNSKGESKSIDVTSKISSKPLLVSALDAEGEGDTKTSEPESPFISEGVSDTDVENNQTLERAPASQALATNTTTEPLIDGPTEKVAWWKYQELLEQQEGGEEVDEDLLEYWELAARQESGEDLTESEIDDMEELRLDLGIEVIPQPHSSVAGNVDPSHSTVSKPGVKASIATGGDTLSAPGEAAKAVDESTPGSGPKDSIAIAIMDGKKEHDQPVRTKTASMRYDELISRQKQGEDIDEDHLDYWELAARQENGEELTESEIDEMEYLRNDLDIDVEVTQSASSSQHVASEDHKIELPVVTEPARATPISNSPWTTENSQRDLDDAQVYQDLLARVEAGEEVDDDLLYFMELLARRRNGEVLVEDELDDIRDFERKRQGQKSQAISNMIQTTKPEFGREIDAPPSSASPVTSLKAHEKQERDRDAPPSESSHDTPSSSTSRSDHSKTDAVANLQERGDPSQGSSSSVSSAESAQKPWSVDFKKHLSQTISVPNPHPRVSDDDNEKSKSATRGEPTRKLNPTKSRLLMEEEARKAFAKRIGDAAKILADEKAEAARLAEEQRIQEEKRIEEESRLALLALEQRIEEENARLQEEIRMAEEKAADDARRKAEEEEARRKAEEDAKWAEEKRIEEARLKAEEEAKLAEEKRINEAKLKAEEETRIAEEKQIAAEQERIAQERLIEEARQRAEEEVKLAEERRIAAEQKRLAEERCIKEAKLKAEEEIRLVEEKRVAAEQARLAQEKLLQEAEEARLRAEEEAKLAEERWSVVEKERISEEKRIEKARLKAIEKTRIAEEKRISAEKARVAEEKRLQEAQLKAREEARIAEEKCRDEARIAKENRIAAEQALKERRRLEAEEERRAAARSQAQRAMTVEAELNQGELREIEEDSGGEANRLSGKKTSKSNNGNVKKTLKSSSRTGLSWRSDPGKSFSDWSVHIIHKDSGKVDAYPVHRNMVGFGKRKSNLLYQHFKNQLKLRKNQLEFHRRQMGNMEFTDQERWLMNSTSRVEVPSPMHAHTFPMVLDYLYHTKEVKQTLTAERACYLFLVARIMQVEGLVKAITDFYTKTTSLNNMGVFLHFAALVNAGPLLGACKNKVGKLLSERPEMAGFVPPVFVNDIFTISRQHWDQLHQRNPQKYSTSWISGMCGTWSKSASISAIDNDLAMTVEAFDGLTSEEAMPVVDPSVAIKLLHMHETFYPTDTKKNDGEPQSLSSLQRRCINSITGNWEKFESGFVNGTQASNALQSLPSHILASILVTHLNQKSSL